MSDYLQANQIWKENDDRFDHNFKIIIEVRENSVLIQSCDKDGNDLNGRRAPVRIVKRSRFDGRKGNYSLHKGMKKPEEAQ